MALLRSTLLGLCVFGALLGEGCGSDPATKPQGDNTDDDDDDSKANKKDAGKDAGKADAGKSDAAAAAASVKCGDTTCKAGAGIAGLPAPTPCCFDEDEGTCSVKAPQSGECTAPAELNENCPDVTVLGNVAKGCCTAETHCGIDATITGMGCLALESPILAMIPGATLPQARTCDGELLEPTTPAPTPDAGKPATGGDAGKADAGASTSSDAGKTTADAGKADAGK